MKSTKNRKSMRKQNHKARVSLLLIASLILGLCLAGCGSKEKSQTLTTGEETVKGQPEEENSEGKGEREDENGQNPEESGSQGEGTQNNADKQPDGSSGEVLPLTELTLPLTEETETITVWFPFSNSYIEDPNEMPAVQEMERITNVHIDWIPVLSAEIAEKFGLLIASGDLPDIVDPTAFTSYPGGDMKSINDGVFLDCEDLIENYMPNYKARITSTEELRIDSMEDDGRFHIIHYMTQSDTKISPEDDWTGLAIRKDWLDDLNLEIPETIEEWHDVLLAFKEKKGATAPLAVSQTVATALNPFLTAYGVGADFMMKDGKVTYGPLEEGYRQWVELFRGWYAEGLIDQKFVTTGPMSIFAPPNEYISGNTTGAFNTSWSYTADTYYKMGISTDPNINVVAVKNPVLNKGDEPKAVPFSSRGNGVACPVYVAADCKNPELVAKWIDFQFSTEGMELNFYGIEGESYTKSADGVYAYTDYIMNNPDGFSPTDAIRNFTTFIPLGMYNWQALEHYSDTTGVLAQAKLTWVDQNRDLLYYTGLVSMTEEETPEYNNLYTALETLVNEKTVQYIMGTESMDTYNAFLQSLHDYGIDRCIEIKQAVYDRYRSRFAK